MEKRQTLCAVWQPSLIFKGLGICTVPCSARGRVTGLRFQQCRRALRGPSPARAALGRPIATEPGLGARAPDAENSGTWTLGTGGGITVKSDVAEEWAEAGWKAERLQRVFD